MEIDNSSSNLKQEPQLSGAYIRSLVKQLTSSSSSSSSSRSKDHPMISADSSSSSSSCSAVAVHEGHNSYNNNGLSRQSNNSAAKLEGVVQQQPHKKQVRRRLHTSRPYQERLLNMAEARREIVTALKYHRAAMKQQQQQQQQEAANEGEVAKRKQESPQHQILPPLGNPMTSYPSSCTLNYPPHPLPPPPPPPCSNYYPPPILSPPTQLNFPLPNQPLGLNLNLDQDFNNIHTLYHHSSSSSSSCPASSSSSPPSLISVSTDEQYHHEGLQLPSSLSSAGERGGGGFHHVLDAEEMAEIRSIGDQHQMEWNDTMNLVTSAWWFKFMKTMERQSPHVLNTDHHHHHHLFEFDDNIMDIPPWLNPNDNDIASLHHINDSHDPALPCMDIGDIEATDGEWWA